MPASTTIAVAKTDQEANKPLFVFDLSSILNSALAKRLFEVTFCAEGATFGIHSATMLQLSTHTHAEAHLDGLRTAERVNKLTNNARSAFIALNRDGAFPSTSFHFEQIEATKDDFHGAARLRVKALVWQQARDNIWLAAPAELDHQVIVAVQRLRRNGEGAVYVTCDPRLAETAHKLGVPLDTRFIDNKSALIQRPGQPAPFPWASSCWAREQRGEASSQIAQRSRL